MLLYILYNLLYNRTYILYEVQHWGLLKCSNEDINHLKRIAINLNSQCNCGESVIILYIKTKSRIMLCYENNQSLWTPCI